MQFVLSWHNAEIPVGAAEIQNISTCYDAWLKYPFISKGYRKYFDGASHTRSRRYNKTRFIIDTFSLWRGIPGSFIRRDPLLLTEFRNRQRVSSDIFKCVIICVTQFVFRVNRIRVVWLGANFSVCIWVADGIGPPDENESKPRPREYIETSLRVLSWFVSTANGLRIVLHILIFSSQFEMKRSYVLSGCSYGRR